MTRVIRNTMRVRWLRHKAQAKYRAEAYDFPYGAWLACWQLSGKQDQMGRLSHQYTMVRQDPTRAWHQHNVKIIQRCDHHTRRCRKYTKDSIEPNYILD